MTLQEKYNWVAIQRDYDTGMTVRQVATKYGMNKGHFDRAKNEGIFKPRLSSDSGKSKNVKDKYDWCEIQQAYDAGLSYTGLRLKFGVSGGGLQKARDLGLFEPKSRLEAARLKRISAPKIDRRDWDAIQKDHNMGFTWDQITKKYNISVTALNNANKSGKLILRGKSEASKLAYDSNTYIHKTLSQDEFVSRAKAVHGDLYDYTKSKYEGMNVDVKIICPKHGEFKNTPLNHIHHSSGCTKCSNSVLNTVSKPEILFLDLIQIPEENRQIRVGRYMVDGIDRENRIIYEFDGDYWHGNPKVFDPNATNKNAHKKFWQLHLKTLRKKSILEDMGYEVINIWESELPLFESLLNAIINLQE